MLLLVARTAAAQPTDAERFYTEGQKAYDDKRYDDALASWQKAYELSHLPGLVFNLAQAHRLRGECTKAVEQYRKFIELDPSSSQRATAEGLIKELEPCKDAPPPATIDHHDVTPPPPPPPKVIAQPPIVIADHDEVDLGHGKRVASVVVGIGGVVALGAGVFFGNRAQSLASEVDQACAAGCAWKDVENKDSDGRTAVTLQWVGYGVGAAALVTSGVLYFLGSHDHHTIAVAPHAGGASVSVLGSF